MILADKRGLAYMNISCQIEGDIAILRILEKKLEYPKTVVLKSYLTRLLEEGHTKLALDMKKVVTLDSFGLAVIVALMKECQAKQGALCLFGLNDFNMKLIEMTKLDKLLNIFATEQLAVSKLQGQAAKPLA
jgi:anti-anti-sigma factor